MSCPCWEEPEFGAVGAKTNLSFDRVRISVNSGIYALLGDLDVYYAYIRKMQTTMEPLIV
ncbi:MAG: hypothetical protein R2769_14605 [Saprospiraceae bacterium]